MNMAARAILARKAATATAAIVSFCALLAPACAQTSDTAAPVSVATLQTPVPALIAFARAWDGVTSYSAMVTGFEQRGSDVQDLVFAYRFRKASSVTMRVIKGPNTGVTLTWDGGSTMQATRGGGLFAALFKRTIALHDPLVETIRGSSLDQLSYGAMLTHAEQTPGTISEAAGEPIDAITTESLTLVPNNPSVDGGFTREAIEISTATNLPIRIVAYEGNTLVRQFDFSDIKPAATRASFFRSSVNSAYCCFVVTAMPPARHEYLRSSSSAL